MFQLFEHVYKLKIFGAIIGKRTHFYNCLPAFLTYGDSRLEIIYITRRRCQENVHGNDANGRGLREAEVLTEVVVEATVIAGAEAGE